MRENDTVFNGHIWSLQYNSERGIRFSSFVVYLRKRNVSKSPYKRRFVDGHPTHHFFYRVVKLWELPAEVILSLSWEGLLPLLPFTKGGKTPEMVEVMLSRLGEIEDKELLASQHVARMTDVNALNVLLVTLFTTQEVEVARQLLENAPHN